MRKTPGDFLDAETLTEIRRNTDWPQLLVALGIEIDSRRQKADEVWAHSPFAEDKRASFHVTPKGWFCFSSGKGGGALELVQQIRGINCYGAARWLLDNGLSSYAGEHREAVVPRPTGAAEQPANRPIRQDLLPLLGTEHPELVRRGISPATCAYLGCGYLPEGGKSPLAGRIVFQVRGVREGELVILSHIGRALSEEQEAEGGKWHHYRGFRKSQELYNIDKLLLDPEAAREAQARGHILLTEGCFDVAKLAEAGIRNAAATFGAHLDPDQLPRLRELAAATGVSRFRIWYDRDPAGRNGQEQAVALINDVGGGLAADGFDWEASFPSPVRGSVKIPETLTDPGEFSGEQLTWLRERGVI